MDILNLPNTKDKSSSLRLALDIGTNSIGWALYKLKNKKPQKIVKTGVRIFSDGRKPKDGTTLNSTRRQHRLQRRQRDRYLQRRSYLLDLLKKHGLFPKDKFSAKKLAELNPYKLRAKGLDEKLELHHFGRALFHINQKRGFKSNRKSADEKENGLISRSVQTSKNLMKKSKSRTYGEFLWKRLIKMEKARKSPSSQQENWILARRAINPTAKDNYIVYANRKMMEDEFNKLWDFQARFHSSLKDQNLKDKFHKVIFFQRNLKKSIVGKCILTGKKRISKASPYFQKFRILKELNNLSYIDYIGQSHYIIKMPKGLEFRDKIVKEHFKKKPKITFKQIEKAFKKFFPKIDNFSRFNLNIFNREDLEGDKTSCVFKKTIPDWIAWDIKTQDNFIELLEGENDHGQFMKSDEEVLKDLEKLNKDRNLNLSVEQLKQCLESTSKLSSDHGKFSKPAIKKILKFLEKGKLEHSAIESAGYSLKNSKYKGELSNDLPKYHEVLADYCAETIKKTKRGILSFEKAEEKQVREISDKKTRENFLAELEKNGHLSKTFLKLYYKKNRKKTVDIEKTEWRITNPTVHIAFNQLRLLVNDIIRVYGKPSQIIVETARDLPLGAKTKGELEKSYKANREKNDEARKNIEEFGGINDRANRFRYRLWKEQNKTCVYSGKNISQSKIWTADLEVDHILPWSKTLDDSIANKVLVYKKYNQAKANKTPYEYFSSNKSEWEGILQRTKNLPRNKRWRFQKDAMEAVSANEGFLSRQLNDTRYISKCAKQYLERVCHDVWTVRGQTTSIFRHLLQHEEKNRMDHRNHAKDALAIGLIDRSFIQHISNVAKHIEGQDKTRMETIGKTIKRDVLPWSSFKEDAKKSIDQIVVSHRKKTKKEGQLHNETAYGIPSDVQDFSQPIEVIHYKDILSFYKSNKKKIEKIISDKIRSDFLKELKTKQEISKKFIEDYHKQTGIRRVRIKEKETVIPIKNKAKKIYKAFSGDSNYAMELFEDEKGQWDAVVINTFKANQKAFKPIPKTTRLMKNDMLFFNNKFWKLVKFDKNKTMIFVEHFVSGNPDIIRENKDTKDWVCQKALSALKETCPKRVDISPCGVFKITPFNLKRSKGKSKNQTG